MISTALILGALGLGFLALFAFLLYSVHDIDSEGKKRTVAIMLHINICLAALEKRMVSGELRGTEELDAAIAKYTTQLRDQGF
jgi:hypothetical protein